MQIFLDPSQTHWLSSSRRLWDGGGSLALWVFTSLQKFWCIFKFENHLSTLMTFKLVLKLSNIKKKKVPNEIIFRSQDIIGEREVLRNHGARQDPCLRILLGVLKHLRLLEIELKKRGLTIFHPPTHHLPAHLSTRSCIRSYTQYHLALNTFQHFNMLPLTYLVSGRARIWTQQDRL